MGQGDLGHALIGLLNAVAREQGTTHLPPTNKWEREVLQDSVAEGDFGLGCTRSARRVQQQGCLAERPESSSDATELMLPQSSNIFQGRDRDMVSFPGFGHLNMRFS